MTTGQKSLRELAETAREAKLEESRESARKNREKSLQAVIEKFYDDYRGFGRLGREGYEITEPNAEDYEFVKDVRLFSGTVERGQGWKITVDGVSFLFGTTHNAESLFAMTKCPKCGVEGGSTFHGLDDLGRLLKFGPLNYQHECLEKETLEVAHAIGRVARDLNIAPSEVVNETFNRHSDVITRLMYR